jgi:hypothetical protein
MLDAHEIEQLLSECWTTAQTESKLNQPRIKIADSYVRRNPPPRRRIITEVYKLRSIHSRTRSHLIYECKHSIIEVFGLNMLAQVHIAEQIEALLYQDRFICREDARQVSSHA